jgi:hypothetical protein
MMNLPAVRARVLGAGSNPGIEFREKYRVIDINDAPGMIAC